MEFFAHFETEKSADPGRMPRTGSGHEPREVNIGGKADFEIRGKCVKFAKRILVLNGME